MYLNARRTWLPCAIVALTATLAPFVSAQSTPVAKPTTSASAEAAVELDPFTVTAGSDVGYVATNTLAGSRLNTPLKDVASSISVMTSEFLSDIGAFEMQSALAYAPNVQSERSEEGAAGNRLVEFFNSYRVRGIQASVGRNFFVWNLPSDVYNLERIEQSRGPNSILFGVGSAGGIINSSTKQPITGRKFETVGLTVGNYDYYRGTLDVNQPLLNGKAGIRFNTVWDDHRSSRFFEYNNTRAGHLSAKWLALERTTIRVEGEAGFIEDNHARNWTVLDRVSIWNTAGRPTLVAPVANAAQGIARYATATNRVTLIDNTGQLFDVKGAMLTATPAAPNNQTAILDRTVADYTMNPGGAGAIRTTDYSTYTGAIEQRIGDKTFIELAYNHQAYEFVGYDPDTTAHMLYGDPNRTLPTGANNTFAGKYFVESNWYRRVRSEVVDNLRLTVSTGFDFGKFGAYRVAALGERQNNEFQRDERREFWAGAAFGGLPEAAQNLVFHRQYATEGDWKSYGLGGGKGHLITNLLDPVTGRTLTSTWIQRNTNTDDDPSRLNSLLAGLEARYFGGKLIAIGGVRRDQLHNENRGTTRDARTQEIIVDYNNVDISDFTYHTRTLGAVFHALPWASVHYNQSNNTSLPNIAHRILPDSGRATGARGKGKDVGVSFNLPNNRAYFKATYYTTESKGQTDFKNMTTIVNRNDAVLDALLAARAISAADSAAHRVTASAVEFGRKADGYEYELVANPTSQWRVSANYTISNLVESNIGDEVVTWAAGTTAYWKSFNPALVTANGETVAAQINNLAADVQSLTATNGVGAIGNRKYKLSGFTRYTFGPGKLMGAFVGGGYRYQSGRVAARSATNELLYGNSLTGVDAVVGYRRKIFANRTTLNLQLNVNNVFNFNSPQTTIMGPTGIVQRFELVAPRDVRLSARLEF